jgi:leucyl-tRNA synthetase
MVEKFGADALRVYELFMAPFDQDVNWNDDGINGARRFLNRTWNLYSKTYHESTTASKEDKELERELHKLIRNVSQRIEDFRFNTMISALMEFVNLLGERYQTGNWRTETYHRVLETLIILIAPAAPYIAEELWHQTKHDGSVHLQDWPQWDAKLAEDETVQIPIQVNGRLRALVEVEKDADQKEVETAAFESPKIQQHIGEGKVKEVIFVSGKIMNILIDQP